MLRNTFLLLLSFVVVACSSVKNGTGSASSDKGFVSLFDGKTTNGWHTYGKDIAGAAWEVTNGELHLKIEGKTRADRGDLVTHKEYENYHLKLEWKISE